MKFRDFLSQNNLKSNGFDEKEIAVDTGPTPFTKPPSGEPEPSKRTDPTFDMGGAAQKALDSFLTKNGLTESIDNLFKGSTSLGKISESKGVAEAKTSGESTYWRVEQSEATGRYHVVTGYQKRKIWENKLGAGDFNSKDAAQKKADELNQKQGVAEGLARNPKEKKLFELLENWGYFISFKTVDLGKSNSIDQHAKQELMKMRSHYLGPVINGMTFSEITKSDLWQNPKVIPHLLKYIYQGIPYVEERIKKFVIPTQQQNYLNAIDKIKNLYTEVVNQYQSSTNVTEGLPGSLSKSDYMPGATRNMTDINKKSKFVVVTNTIGDQAEHRVSVNATSENDAKNQAYEYFVSKGLKPRVDFDGLRVDSLKEEMVDELSTAQLARYKKASSADASAADKSGDTERANKRFRGIVTATIKQFDNETKPKDDSQILDLKKLSGI
jgi:hypothetical protein